jgi:arsenate-mycothiol transferase
MTEATGKPSVLFVCVKNAGKSQMAAGLLSKAAGDTVQAYSAGTKPGTAVNDLSAQALAEVGVDITRNIPTLIDEQLVRDVDFVVSLGREARVDPVPGTQLHPGVRRRRHRGPRPRWTRRTPER